MERDPLPLPVCAEAIGIDVGLTTFAVLSDGTEIQNPRYYRNAEARLRRCQRKLARRRKGSNRRRKAVRLLQRANIHVRNQRADFQHKEARRLVNGYGVIAVEDLNVKGLAGGMSWRSPFTMRGGRCLFKCLSRRQNAPRDRLSELIRAARRKRVPVGRESRRHLRIAGMIALAADCLSVAIMSVLK